MAAAIGISESIGHSSMNGPAVRCRSVAGELDCGEHLCEPCAGTPGSMAVTIPLTLASVVESRGIVLIDVKWFPICLHDAVKADRSVSVKQVLPVVFLSRPVVRIQPQLAGLPCGRAFRAEAHYWYQLDGGDA